MSHVTCHVHVDKTMPRELAHSHHVNPRLAKGSDDSDNLIWLCPDCHHAIHQLATMLAHGRAEAVHIAHEAYPHPPTRKRALQLASLVSEGIARKKAGEVVTDHVVPIVLEPEVFSALRHLAARYKHGGRRVGVARFVEALVLRELRQKGFKIPEKR